MGTDMTEPHRADLPTWECLDLVGGRSVGRLCFLDGDTPIAYPISFKLHRGDTSSYVVMRIGPGSLVAKYTGPASFEVDEIDVEARAAWSVLMRGVVRRSHETEELPVPDPWIADGTHRQRPEVRRSRCQGRLLGRVGPVRRTKVLNYEDLSDC